MLWSRWLDRRGALRFRELYRAASEHDGLATATHDAAFVAGEHPLLARAIDLDVLHWYAHDATDLADLVRRWRESLRVHDIPRPRSLPDHILGSTASREHSAQLAGRHAAIAGVERELLAQIEADPRSDAPLVVYADWLEIAGRIDEATAVRARVTPT